VFGGFDDAGSPAAPAPTMTTSATCPSAGNIGASAPSASIPANQSAPMPDERPFDEVLFSRFFFVSSFVFHDWYSPRFFISITPYERVAADL